MLEEAIEQLRDLPEEEQDAAADVLFVYIASDAREYQLQPHQVAEVHRIRRGLRDGSARLATDAEVKTFRQKYPIMRLRFTSEALTHIDAIAFYLGHRSPAAAAHIVGRIFADCDRLAEFPHLGHAGSVRDTLNGRLRDFPTSLCTKSIRTKANSLSLRSFMEHSGIRACTHKCAMSASRGEADLRRLLRDVAAYSYPPKIR